MATKAKLTRIEKRKKLEALFDRGAYVYFNAEPDGTVVVRKDGEEQPEDMRIWVRPASPLQREMVVREAQAARARAMVTARDEDSREWITIRGFIAALTMDGLVEYVMDLDEATRLSEARRDVLKEKEWEDFNALRDAMRQFEESGAERDDPEWASLMKRDQAFGDQVADRADELRADAREAFKLMPRPDLEKRAFEKRLDQAGSAAFMDSYETWMLYYACRDDDDHLVQYFDDPDDLKSAPQELQDGLSNRLARFITDAGEAKNSQGAVAGLPSSAPSDAPEISESSTPEESSD